MDGDDWMGGCKVLRNAFGTRFFDTSVWKEHGRTCNKIVVSRLGVIGLVILKGIPEAVSEAVKATAMDDGGND